MTIERVWRVIRSMPPPDTRPDFYCIADTATLAEERVRASYPFEEGESLSVELMEEFEWPVKGCRHPRRCLIFWQYGKGLPRHPGKVVRCYRCYRCGAAVHDDTPDSHMVPCEHIQRRSKPSEDEVW